MKSNSQNVSALQLEDCQPEDKTDDNDSDAKSS